MGVKIIYKGKAISETEAAGTETLKMAGTYCEGDISVEYAPRSRSYDVTIAESINSWTVLVALDDDVLAHINDPGLVVTFVRIGEFAPDVGARYAVFAANNAFALQNSEYPVYGVAIGQGTASLTSFAHVYYPAKNTTGSVTSIGGFGGFMVAERDYSIYSIGHKLAAGSYRLTFQW